jgi:hypothetical protein
MSTVQRKVHVLQRFRCYLDTITNLHGAQNIPTKLWMDSSCHLLPSCKNSDAKETSTKCNNQKEKLVHHEKNQMQIIDSMILPLFFCILQKFLLHLNFCMMVEDDMSYPSIILLECFEHGKFTNLRW